MTLKILAVCLAVLGVTFCFDKLVEDIKKIHRHEDEELTKFTGDQYMEKSSAKQGKMMFDFMDADKNGFVTKDEMREFGKLMVTNETEHLDFWIEGNFKNDDDKDGSLSFKEFFKPQILYGEKTYDHEEL